MERQAQQGWRQLWPRSRQRQHLLPDTWRIRLQLRCDGRSRGRGLGNCEAGAKPLPAAWGCKRVIALPPHQAECCQCHTQHGTARHHAQQYNASLWTLFACAGAGLVAHLTLSASILFWLLRLPCSSMANAAGLLLISSLAATIVLPYEGQACSCNHCVAIS